MVDPLYKKIEQAVNMVENNHERKVTVESGTRSAHVYYNAIQENIAIIIKSIPAPTTDIAGIGMGIEQSVVSKGRR